MILPWKRLFAFGGLQLIGAIAPILVLPVVVRLIGVNGWVGLSLGYAIGAVAAIAINYGWPITGPSRVAAVSEAAAAKVFAESLVMRSAVAVPILGIAILVSVLLTPPDHRGLAVAMTVAMASSGMTSNWYYIGRGTPNGIMHYEAVPKLVATLVTIPFVHFTHVAMLYPLFLLCGTLIGVFLSIRQILSGNRDLTPFAPGMKGRYASYGLVAASGVLGAGYTSLALPLMQLAGATLVQVANFAGSFRLRSMAQVAIGTGTMAFQGWVSEQDVVLTRRHRMRAALVTSAGLGVLTGLLLFLTGPLLGTVLFGDAARISYSLSALTGLACIPYSLSASLSFHILAPLGHARAVASSRILATFAGVPLIFMMSKQGGANGAATAILLSESIVVLLQALSVYRIGRGKRGIKARQQAAADAKALRP